MKTAQAQGIVWDGKGEMGSVYCSINQGALRSRRGWMGGWGRVPISVLSIGINPRDTPPSKTRFRRLPLVSNMASTFFHWLRSPAARQYFFSMFSTAFALDGCSHIAS